MYYVMGIVGVLLMVFLLFREKRASVSAALKALEEPLKLSPHLEPYEEDEEGNEGILFVNSKINLSYFRSVMRTEGVRHCEETIQFALRGYSGDYTIHFRDDVVTRWIHNAKYSDPKSLNDEALTNAHKILEAAREAWKNLSSLPAA